MTCSCSLLMIFFIFSNSKTCVWHISFADNTKQFCKSKHFTRKLLTSDIDQLHWILLPQKCNMMGVPLLHAMDFCQLFGSKLHLRSLNYFTYLAVPQTFFFRNVYVTDTKQCHDHYVLKSFYLRHYVRNIVQSVQCTMHKHVYMILSTEKIEY